MTSGYQLVDHARYIVKVTNKLRLDERAKRKALDLMEQAQKKDIIAGKDPTGMAASILYLVNLTEMSPKTQGEIASAAGVTEVTVRNRSKELRKRLDIDLGRHHKTPVLSKSNKDKVVP